LIRLTHVKSHKNNNIGNKQKKGLTIMFQSVTLGLKVM